MQPPEEVDIVVVGPDLSGLTAEEPIINHGYSCIVLEARDRVGGRPWFQEYDRFGACKDK
jgi:monoamine oxidase